MKKVAYLGSNLIMYQKNLNNYMGETAFLKLLRKKWILIGKT